MPGVLRIVRLGTVGYDEAAAIQAARVEARLAGEPDTLLLLEHPPVYTLGRAGDAGHLRGAAALGIPVRRSERGGQATYHGPGQLVAYPIVHLARVGYDVRAYVRTLEAVIIGTLAAWRIAGRREPGRPGVWVGARKIASIGIAIRRWVAWHGLAVNVGPDLAAFDAITPCGIDGLRMTAMALEGGPDAVAAVRPVLEAVFVREFGFGRVEIAEPTEAGEARP